MKYIIMADGKGTRWNNYHNIPKHLIESGGETLLARTVRLLRENDARADIVITSHDPRYEVPGARRYEPQNNHWKSTVLRRSLLQMMYAFSTAIPFIRSL